MAIVHGPLFSMAASGTIGEAIVFSKWKGRSYVRERVIPSNPKSGGQVGRRAMFKYLTQVWSAQSSSDQDSWQDIADQIVASPFNAFIKHNMQRWHNFLTPGKASPVGDTGLGSDRILSAAAWEENRIKISSTATAANQQWGFIYFAKLAGAVTPSVGNAIIIELDEDIDNRDTFWTPPSVGTWHFDSIAFSEDGTQVAAGGGQNAAP